MFDSISANNENIISNYYPDVQHGTDNTTHTREVGCPTSGL